MKNSSISKAIYNIDRNDSELQAFAEYKCKEIHENQQQGNRDYNTVFGHCLNGAAAEISVKELLGGTLNRAEFDKTDFTTYAYDFTRKNGSRCEIKTIIKIHPYINFNLRQNLDEVYHATSYPDLTTCYENKNYVDNIIFVRQNFNQRIISSHLLCIIDTQEFFKKMKTSQKITKGSTNYVITETLKKIHIF